MTRDARLYETMYIINPALPEAEIESTQEDIRGIIKEHGGTIKKDTNWGKRRLSYEINKITEGIYINLEFTADTELPSAFNEYVHTHTSIIRHLVFRIPKSKLTQEKNDEERLRKQAEKKEEYERAQAAKAAAAEAAAKEAAEAETAAAAAAEDAPVADSAPVAVETAAVEEPKAAEVAPVSEEVKTAEEAPAAEPKEEAKPEA